MVHVLCLYKNLTCSHINIALRSWCWFCRKDRAVDEEDEYHGDENKTYYSIAHNRHEAVTKQPDMLQFGTLKTYQVRWLLAIL